MNRSYSKIRHMQQSNFLLEQRRIDEGVLANLSKGTPAVAGAEIKEQGGQTLTNKVATEGIKNVLPQMISSPPFEGDYSGYVFGGTFNGIRYNWDCNGVEGMSGVRGFVDGQILSETVENLLTSVGQTANDAKPNSPSVGFYSNNAKFLIYTTTAGSTKCLTF